MEERKFFDMSSKQSLVMGLSWGIALIAVVGLIFFAAGGQPAGPEESEVLGADVNANTNVAPQPTPTQPSAADVSKLLPITDEYYTIGPKDAKVTLIEVSEFQCPYCKRHTPTMEQIMKEYEGKVRRVWVHFPLTSIHPYAQKAAEAVECAGEQQKSKFWELHDKLFENQEAITVDDIKGYAKEIGLNTSQFNECLDSGKYTAKVQKQTAAAAAAGVTGTPGTFVNGELVKGAYPFDTFKQIIDELLAE